MKNVIIVVIIGMAFTLSGCKKCWTCQSNGFAYITYTASGNIDTIAVHGSQKVCSKDEYQGLNNKQTDNSKTNSAATTRTIAFTQCD